MAKREFHIGAVLRRVRRAVAGLPKAALFELAEAGHRTVFEQVAACIISTRTRDEVTLAAAQRLFAAARTPAAAARLGVVGLDARIRGCTFHERKAAQIHEIARRALAERGGDLPCDEEVLRSLPGVGAKCANLVLAIACGQPRIGVDAHVHRVTNRWGYVRTSRPEATARALAEKLPRRYWVEINRLLVPFGKHICTGRLPRCSTCPVLEYCRQVGVEAHR
ncbi:MAG: endonuclease III [bacterium]